ncbi:MAG: alpha/beta hydrolase, partial [Planctomycetota bacterium]
AWKPEDKRPAIVFFFGGGWATGSVRQFEEQAAHLARRGMVAARADYRVRMRHNVTPDRCVEDAKSAVRYLRQHAAVLGIDPNRIVAAGGSAGGHIAACTSLTDGLEAENENLKVSSKPNALVLFNPALSFVDSPRLMFLIANDAELGKTISPTEHLSKQTPPTLLLYGTGDPLYAQGQDYLKRAEEAGCRCEMFTAEGKPHGFFNRQPWKQTTLDRVDAFLVSLGYLDTP